MKLLHFIIIMLLPALTYAQDYQIDWWVIGSGGGHSQSESYQMDGTIGQPIVGTSSSPNYIIDAGFWVGAAPAGGACDYFPGDINDNGIPNGVDVSYAVNYLKGIGPPPPVECPDCPSPGQNLFAAGDVNANCQFNGVDVTYYVNYLKGIGPALSFCASCPPAGGAPPVPAVQPIRTPVLEAGEMHKAQE